MGSVKVQTSIDGVNWTTIYTVNGSGDYNWSAEEQEGQIYIRLTVRDSKGNENTTTLDLPITIVRPVKDSDHEQEEDNAWVYWAGGGVVFMIIVVILLVFIMMRKRKQFIKTEDEELEEKPAKREPVKKLTKTRVLHPTKKKGMMKKARREGTERTKEAPEQNEILE